MRQLIRAAALVAALLFLAPVAAQSAAEDEARIEELIRRERARNRPAAVSADTPAAQAGVSTAAVAAPPATGTPTPAVAPASAPAVATASAPALPRDAPIEPTIFGDDVMPPDPDSIAIADLAAHVGRHVRVRSHGGRSRIGRIESVGSDRLTLTTPMGGGFAKYTLPFSQITGIERL
ncbi:MAG TPA: hypothetical protein VFO79_11475 [Xanthomonadales bacterium]|nr:hypothetical protein [Xanthomonadales bacterium]